MFHLVFLFHKLSCTLYFFGGLLPLTFMFSLLLVTVIFFFFFTFLSTVTGLVRGHVRPGLSTVEAWDQHGSIFYLAFCLTQSILCYPLMTSIDIWFVYLVV